MTLPVDPGQGYSLFLQSCRTGTLDTCGRNLQPERDSYTVAPKIIPEIMGINQMAHTTILKR